MVGAHLICTMLRQGLKVRATRTAGEPTNYTKHVMSFYTDDYDALFDEIQWVDTDLGDIVSLADAMDGIDTVFCCRVPKIKWGLDISDNVNITKNIVAAAQNSSIKGFYYLGNYLALGDEPENNEVNELSQRNPKGKYSKLSRAHYFCEMEVQRAIEEGLPASIIAPTVVLGPGNWLTDTSHLFPDAPKRKYFTRGVAGFVGVNDIVKSLMSLARNRIHGEKFIVNSQNLNYLDIFTMIANTMGVPAPQKEASCKVISLYQFCYAVKSIFTGRRPVRNRLYIYSLTQYRLFDNRKSIGRVIAAYETIESVIETIAAIYKKERAAAAK